MDYVKPAEVAKTMVEAGRMKLSLSPRDLLIRGALSGALLGTATSFAFTAAVSTGQPLVGALIFPVGLVMIVILGLELVTGSFALVPLPYLEGRASPGAVIANWGWVFLGNLLGSIGYGVLLAIALTNFWHAEPTGVAARFEHTVVNMFIIPTGMLMGAKVTVADWWLWNQIPVTLGNLLGGFIFTGLALYATYRPAASALPMTDPIAAKVPAE